MKTVLIADTTFFHVAATYLGDATRWDEIARLNKVLDPLIVGIKYIKIPLQSDAAVMVRGSL